MDDSAILEADGWDRIEDADVLPDPESKSPMHLEDTDDEIDIEDGRATQLPRGLPAPAMPSKEEKDRHELTHINYRSWCPHCVFGRRNNTAHRSASSGKRNLPLFCADYCFIRDIDDPENLTCMVGRMYPSKAIFATACDQKGADDEAVSRLTSFLRETGIHKMIYKTDQESSLRAAIEEAMRRLGRSGSFEPFEAVPEVSAVGESASNGKAERAIQSFEDQLRTLKSALDSRLQTKVPVNHPLMRWLVEHSANVLNRYALNSDGVTPYQALHGKRSTLRVVEFGEQVLFYLPKKSRAKLTRRWRLGTYLGLSNSSNEHFIATRDGNVLRSRSIVRVVERSRWSAEAALGVTGTPTLPNPNGLEDPHGRVEESDVPHLDMDAVAESAEPPLPQAPGEKNFAPGKIMDVDIRKYGYSDDCPRCRDLQTGKAKFFRPHTDICRMRFYLCWKEHKDPKYLRVRHLLEPDAEDIEPADLDLDNVDLPAQKPPEPAAPPTSYAPAPETPQSFAPYSPTSAAGTPREDFGTDDGMMMDGEPPFDLDEGEDADAMIDYLVIIGADRTEARHKVNAMMGKGPATFMEVYGRGAIVEEANKSRRRLDLKGIGAMDIRTCKADGSNWDFNKRSDRRMARELIDSQNPDWLIGSPPCTAFSLWNIGINYKKMEKSKVDQLLKEGRNHLNFVASLYRKQMLKGKFFLHEHPASAASWKESSIASLAALSSVYTTVAHQCMYGLTTPTTDGQRAPAMKATRFMTNSVFMSRHLSKVCDHLHAHQQLSGGRCADAAFYPLPLVKAIINGMSDTTDHLKRCASQADEAIDTIAAMTNANGRNLPEPTAEPVPTSGIKKVTGGVLPIAYHPVQFKAQYVDEYTGQVLDPLLAQAAIMEELNYFNDHVWEVSSKEEMYSVPEHIMVRSRWVCCNKGDEENPDIRCRLVACEINKGGDRPDHFFASTPPLEAKKLLFARFAQERQRSGKPLNLSFIDVRKAYFNGIPRRPLYMQFPKELGLPPNCVGKLVRCAYGTRDAGAIWEDAYRGALEEMGFVSGVSSPCCFYHPERQISTVVHGDDFTSMGLGDDLTWLETTMATHFEIKIRGRLGEDCKGPQQIRILNRIVTLTPEGLMYEADPRHVDLLSKSMGLTSANAVATPGIKDPTPDYDAVKTDESDAVTYSDFPAVNADDVINALRPRESRVTFSEDVQSFEVPAYSTIYGIDPRLLAATAKGWRRVKADSDPYTGKSIKIMEERLSELSGRRCRQAITLHRERILSQYLSMLRSYFVEIERCTSVKTDENFNFALLCAAFPFSNSDGQRPSLACALSSFNQAPVAQSNVEPESETESLPMPLDPKMRDVICATRTAPAKKKTQVKRAGAKTVKAMERLSSAYVLNSEDATTFRALSARGNFLGQDRTDIGYSTKELCREFSVPNRNSQARLKRVGRYLVGKPRLVYLYNFGKGVSSSDCFDIYVDTDFAGCKESRRSTSGGIVTLNGSNVKHWSKTQSTIALSSGEAELHGIGAGIAQGLGMQSLAKDLGFTLGVRIHSDATAALGICRRRGLGKIRHLDVTDLWCQEKVRTGAVSLHKVLGTENPADIMTKYTDRATLEKMLGLVNMKAMAGRAECAPANMG